ncbi:sterol desaturase family protein [Gilvimarinus sp. 1_MG-2023]|uniref:sterol desaturase family protein n=1 Tax=Gilvimarinus sp. 1_MG-2023 TaxID=3062638 RepID=UPI0026E3E5E3|nr:sterol desaturase family protein [Gilvimarinus sp. 1_MG-2023]MDO6746159.1 sterol desaturase family protein [Gilvimarinus sp. 1_MG-2023]
MTNELAAIIQSMGQWLLVPFGYALDAASRMYWLFWCSALGIALLVILYSQWRDKKLHLGRAMVQLFSPRHWWRRSTLVDLAYLFANSLLRLGIVIPLFGSHLLVTLWVTRGLQSELGNAPEFALSGMTVAALYTLCFFLVEDFSRFGLHRTMHKVPFLWRLHQVHHSARRLTPLTLFRVHPFEMTLYYLRGLLVFGSVSGVFVYLFGGQLSGWDILGVDALGFAFNFLGANLRHSHIWLSFGRLERWFISPAGHQLHHSRLSEHRNKNFGTCLALWDRLFGSHLPAEKQRPKIAFGLSRRPILRKTVQG